MSEAFDHLHIKSRTAGSSNELSFDVLDAARTDMEGKAAKAPLIGKSAISDKGSYRGISGTTALSRQAEVEKRKKSRKTKRIALWVIVSVALIALVAALLLIGYRQYLEAQDFALRFDSLVDQFSDEDQLISELDDVMASFNDDNAMQKRKEAMEAIPDAIAGVEKIKANASSAGPLALTDQDKAALEQIVRSANARVDLLNAASSTLQLVEQREERVSSVMSVWNDIVDCAQAAKQASSLANAALTREETDAALQATEKAHDGLASALDELKSLESGEVALDLSEQKNYVEQKIAALSYAIETGKALLDGDRDRAQTANESYNAADKKAANMAKNLPLSPEQSVQAAYASQLAGKVAVYDELRQKVVDSDNSVREYLAKR